MFSAIRCDVCGRFIPYADLEAKRAVRYLDTPDSDYSRESYRTLCAAHVVADTPPAAGEDGVGR
jgi:hypothetical protein